MTDYTPETPIVVNSNPLPAILQMTVRSVVLLVGGGLVASGYVDDQQLSTLAGVAVTLTGFGWGVFLNYKNTKTKTLIAEAAPNTVAVVK